VIGTGTIVVFGAGGHGKVVADAARAAGHQLAAFVDDDEGRDGAVIWDVPVVSWSRLQREREQLSSFAVALGVGGNAAREACHARLVAAGLPVATVVHPAAVVAPTARLGEGTVVLATAVVNPDAVVGRGVIINTGAVVEHDCQIGDYAHLSPNAALGGGVSVGRRSHLGLGAVAIPGARIGSDVRVGAGAVVLEAVADGLTVVGVPASPVSRKGTSR
jgi:sugar O-acyltransferase (sialic acid O-acetyltransferase NeuD family)